MKNGRLLGFCLTMLIALAQISCAMSIVAQASQYPPGDPVKIGISRMADGWHVEILDIDKEKTYYLFNIEVTLKDNNRTTLYYLAFEDGNYSDQAKYVEVYGHWNTMRKGDYLWLNSNVYQTNDTIRVKNVGWTEAGTIRLFDGAETTLLINPYVSDATWERVFPQRTCAIIFGLASLVCFMLYGYSKTVESKLTKRELVRLIIILIIALPVLISTSTFFGLFVLVSFIMAIAAVTTYMVMKRNTLALFVLGVVMLILAIDLFIYSLGYYMG